jgi:acetyltransferase-like isoleucine patch superfamily enzyme
VGEGRQFSTKDWRLLASVVTALLPWQLKRLVFRARGWDVHPTARVGLTLLDVDHLTMGPGARIGHFNLFSRVKRLSLGKEAYVGSLNRVAGPGDVRIADRVQTDAWPSVLELGDNAMLFNSNFIDLASEVRLGDGALMAGGFTRIWTHDPLPSENGMWALEPRPVTIGAGAYVGAGSVLLPGTRLPDRCVLGAGSVLTKQTADCAPGSKLAGNPARQIGEPSRSETPTVG